MKMAYKTWFKTLAALLCVLLMTAGCMGVLLVACLYWDGDGTPEGKARSMTMTQLREDLNELEYYYFWPEAAEEMTDEGNAPICTGQNSNFRYTITAEDTGEVLVSTLQDENTAYHIRDRMSASHYEQAEQDGTESAERSGYIFDVYVLSDLQAQDDYTQIQAFCGWLRGSDVLPWAAGGCLLLSLALLVLLCCAAGHQAPDGALKTGMLHRLPWDLVLAVSGCWWIATLAAGAEALRTFSIPLWVLGPGLMLMVSSVLGVYMVTTIAVRAKTGTLAETTLLLRLLRLLKRGLAGVLRALPFMWKTAVVWGGLCLLELFLLAIWNVESDSVVLWFGDKLLLTPVVVYGTIMLLRLKQGAESIAAGDYTTPVDDSHMVLELKDTADTLNHIRGGMNAAVESRIRSERMKTELITNVSHDLKTPLTAIVSYVDLLKQEPAGSPQAAEYIEVLDRQSARLKRLTEDLVEASKAATGNVELSCEPLDAAMLTEQALGEYGSRLEQAGLTVVFSRPQTEEGPVPAMIQADGRQLWRVLDNLLNNAVKYALPGTRFYADVTADEQVALILRNISKEPLNISAEELMERFVRGDTSRHTEGSGLGLSIARSLTEAMGGSFSLEVDGDLFKVTVSFPAG